MLRIHLKVSVFFCVNVIYSLLFSVYMIKRSLFDALVEIDLSSSEISARIKESIDAIVLKQRACEEKGHPNAVEKGSCYFRGRLEIYMHCTDCGLYYERKPTSADYKALDRVMNLHLD